MLPELLSYKLDPLSFALIETPTLLFYLPPIIGTCGFDGTLY
jgi:hypothetical protein